MFNNCNRIVAKFRTNGIQCTSSSTGLSCVSPLFLKNGCLNLVGDLPQRLSLAILCVALVGCTQSPDSENVRLVSKIRALECAIGFSAIEQMRANSRLADPFMVKDCAFDPNAPILSLNPALDGSAATTKFGRLLVNRLQERRFPAEIIEDIKKSAPFADAEILVAKLNQH